MSDTIDNTRTRCFVFRVFIHEMGLGWDKRDIN
jgi:hypothetical protein